MNILSLNAGSSTLKYKLYSLPDEKLVLEGGLDHSGSASIADAAKKAIEQCKADKVDAIGHRVVHGGSRFAKPTLINADMVRGLREISSLDPLHNPTEVAMIEAGFSALPNVPAVAVFDTAFHQTMPEVAWRYAIPRDVADTHELRRYGSPGMFGARGAGHKAHYLPYGQWSECLRSARRQEY
jgi:acetate kinase